MRRWWQRGERSIEEEQAWFDHAGLLFTVDRDVLDRDGVCVFRGELRFGERRCSTDIVYPSGYLAGHHPVVIVPDLPVGRHKGPGGVLCTDHPVLGVTTAMVGAEAAKRAERLWHLSKEDPDALREEEADAPEPRVGWYAYEPGSAVLMADVDVNGHRAAASGPRGGTWATSPTLSTRSRRPTRAPFLTLPHGFPPGRGEDGHRLAD